MPPLFVILLSFFLAKAILVVIVLGTTFLPEIPVPLYHPPQWPFGYDSSSSLFLPVDGSRVGRMVAGLFRWDTVYFVGLAERGEYVWEQEWAFGPGWPMLIRHAVPLLQQYLPSSLEDRQRVILTSIILSNTFHLLALIPLFYLTRRIFPLTPSLATVTCVLHAFSPAGVFLLAGYTESLFLFLSFSGMALFHSGFRLLPAIVWALAGTVRSNALLWTGFFAWDAINTIIASNRQSSIRTAGKVMYLSICALFTLGGFAWWQYSAWEQYCSSSTPAPWCSNPIPLIYSHVQSTYWDVGFLRYWTTNQLPNFLIAAPHIILSILALSSHLRNKHTYHTFLSNPLTPHILALTGMSTLLLTSMHVQIATRVLTTFPALYWYVAEKVSEDIQGLWAERPRFWEGGIRGIITFGCVGAVLFSAFLPPA